MLQLLPGLTEHGKSLSANPTSSLFVGWEQEAFNSSLVEHSSAAGASARQAHFHFLELK